MRYLILTLLLSFSFSECDELTEIQCTSNADCEWFEDISLESCDSFGNSGSCNSVSGCNWDSYCAQWHHLYTNMCVDWDYWCDGEYQIDDSYCQENPNPPTCSEMSQTQCNNNSDCQWTEDIEIGHCSDFSSWQCGYVNDECWGDLCYGGSYGSWSFCCRGGSYEIDNSYCEDSDYIQGDLNGDLTLNILDVIIIVDIILNQESSDLADINGDGIVNILDIIELVDLILE